MGGFRVRKTKTSELPTKSWIEAITRTRQVLGLTQKQLAQELGLASQSYISDLEKGRVQPSLHVLQKLHPLIKKALGDAALQLGSSEALAEPVPSELHPAVKELIEACNKLTVREVEILRQIAENLVLLRTAPQARAPLIQALERSPSHSPWRQKTPQREERKGSQG